MILAFVTLITALAISAVAAFYSIVGLMAIFSASALSIAVMGIVLEIGKLDYCESGYTKIGKEFLSCSNPILQSQS